ncbi:MAG: enoyl-CoA hydratase [Gammaproteobacteria bacterium]|nr:MAG: enoyl-CoA hydratase [Gammaproteobacteria bacterium]
MHTERLIHELSDSGVLRLTLNDAQRRNALSLALLEALAESLQMATQNQQVRVIVIAANGPAFCAGHDLKEINEARAQEDEGLAFFTHLFTLCSQVMQAIVHHPKPVIAEIDGVATAAGCQLVASCDLAIATEHSRFATPGVNIGLFCSTPMIALSRNVAPKHAMEMLLTGDMISAEKAQHIGLVNQVVSATEISAQTLALAEKIAAKSTLVLKIGKRAFYEQLTMALPEAYEYASQVMVDNMLKADAKEGIAAFIGKRPPQWRDE